MTIIALATFASCERNNGLYDPAEDYHHFCIKTTAPVLETDSPETRAEMKASVRLQWTDGDQISVVNLSTGKTMLGNLTAKVVDDKVTFEGDLSGSIKAGNKMAAIYPSQNYSSIINVPDFVLDLSNQNCTTKEELAFVAYSLFECKTTGMVDVSSDFSVPVSFNQITLATIDPETKIDYVELTNVGNSITFHANKETGTLELTPSVGKVRISPESKLSGKNGALFTYCALASSPASSRAITVKAIPKIYYASWAESAMAASKFYTSVASNFESQEYKDFMVSAPSSLDVGYQGGTVVFSVTSNNISWNASSTPALTISPSSGKGCENLEVTVTVPKNNESAERSFLVTLSGGAEEYHYTITQKADPNKEIVEIPDINLKKYLLPLFDEDEDGEISVVEAELIQNVNCSGRNIADLSGLERCPNLKYLNFNGNYVSEILLPDLSKLETIVAYGNPIEKIVVNNDVALTTLNLQDVSVNALSGDSFSIDGYNQAETLYLAFVGTKYTTINLTNSTVLSSINISENVQLTKLVASGNSLIQSFDLETLVNLTDLDVKNCNLSVLNVDSNVNLVNLDCSNNKIASLNVDNNVALVSLICPNNQLSSLRVTNNVNLEKIDAMSNLLSSFNVRKCLLLKELNVANNSDITALALGYNTELVTLYAYKTGLTDIDLTANTKLERLNLNGCSELHVIDLSANTALKILNLASTPIATLDLSKQTSLQNLNVSSTSLSSLDLSNNTSVSRLTYDEGLSITSAFSVGSYIVVNGVPGVVFFSSSSLTKIVSTNQTSLTWGPENVYIKGSSSTGPDIMVAILEKGIDDYPAFKWCRDKGIAWYLPNRAEMTKIYESVSVLNTTLASGKGTKFSVESGSSHLYWTSSQYSTDKAYYVSFVGGSYAESAKSSKKLVRAVRTL